MKQQTHDYRGREIAYQANRGDIVTSRWNDRGVRWIVEGTHTHWSSNTPMLQLRSLSSNRTRTDAASNLIILERAA